MDVPKRTLWERMMGRTSPPPVVTIGFHPLPLKVSSSVTIDLVDYNGQTFFVNYTSDVVRTINGKTHHFADYIQTIAHKEQTSSNEILLE